MAVVIDFQTGAWGRDMVVHCPLGYLQRGWVSGLEVKVLERGGMGEGGEGRREEGGQACGREKRERV